MKQRWQRWKQRLLIVGPPILLLLIGAAVYIMVVKLSEPEVQTISALPVESTQSAELEASSGAVLTTVTTEVVVLSADELRALQAKVDAGQEAWRADPLAAAKRLSLEYGFLETDPLTRQQTTSSATLSEVVVEASHQGKIYLLTMTQPGKTGNGGVWVVEAIELK